MNTSLRTALLVYIGVSGTLRGQTAPSTSLLVLSKHDQTLAIVDGSSLQVVAKVPVGNDPHEVIASTDGATAYVSNYGSGAYNTLAVVDLVARKAGPSIDLGALRGPHGLTFVGGKAWFTAEAAKAIGRYDPATRSVDLIVGTGQDRTHMIDVSADGRQIITTNVSSGTVSIIEPASTRTRGDRTDWHQTVIRVGGGAEGFDVSPDRKEVWVANAQDGTISIIDLAGKKVTQTLAANVGGANRLKFTPDGARVLVSTLSGPDLVVLDARARKEIKRVPIGRGAAGIVMQPDGSRAFVACTPDNYVAVIDLRTLTVAGHIQAGDEPDGLAWVARPGPAREGFLPVPGGRIWYRRSGAATGTPVILLHGGPGFSSFYLKSLEGLGAERPVVRYDQLGGGKSDRITDVSIMTIPHFVAELDSLRRALGYDRVHLVGHSWGTILATEYYRAHPEHVASITLGSAALDMHAWRQNAVRLIATLPDSSQQAIHAGEAEKKYDAPAYKAAMDQYYAKYVWRHPVPADLDSTMSTVNDSIYDYMEGPTEFTITGTIKDYDATGFLPRIQVPVLFTVGEFDEADPATIKRFASLTPGARYVVIAGAAHVTPWDNAPAMLAAVGSFLRSVDSTATATVTAK